MPSDAVYNSYKTNVANGTINLATATLKVMLVAGYTADVVNHKFRSDVTSFEITGTGYTLGGVALGSLSVTENDTTNKGVFTAGNASWASSTITAAGAIIYNSTGTNSTSQLIAYFDFGGSKSSSNGTFQITWNGTGILTFG